MADVVLIVHFAWVLCVVVPVPLIILGTLLGWRWVRSFWLRTIHLGMMLFVALESVIGMVCPLTMLEDALRQEPGGRRYEQSNPPGRPFGPLARREHLPGPPDQEPDLNMRKTADASRGSPCAAG